MGGALSPAKSPASLTEKEQEIARLMVEGHPHGISTRAGWRPAGAPLTLLEAAEVAGYRLKRARQHLDPNPEFRAYCASLLKERRNAEGPRNLATLIRIRDNPGAGLAADRTVQLKAVAAIEGADKAPAVTVNVNQQTNVATVTPGYVIRLPAARPPEGA